MRCKSALAAMVTAILLAATAAKADSWLTYQNDRYGTTIDYPDVFKMQPPPGSDDGREFKSPDGADFTVSASYFALDLTVAKYRDFIVKNLDRGSAITYEIARQELVRHFRNGGRQAFFMKSIDCRTA